jgi:hypothetical protein
VFPRYIGGITNQVDPLIFRFLSLLVKFTAAVGMKWVLADTIEKGE